MNFFFAHDSTHRGAREYMGKLVAFGRLLLDGSNLITLSETTDSILEEFGILENEEVMRSPRKGNWNYDNLGGDARLAFTAKLCNPPLIWVAK